MPGIFFRRTGIVIIGVIFLLLTLSAFFAFGGTKITLSLFSNGQLTSGLIAYYSFDDLGVSGTTVTDESGSGNTGTYVIGTGSSFDAPQSTAFTNAGSTTYSVPSDITQIKVKAWGGGGGGGRGNSNTATGGGGGFAQATINVTPGETLDVVVGGPGLTAATACSGNQAGGGGGGGYSAVKRSSTFLIQAGGGGGGGGISGAGETGGNGGAGGGSSGVAGDNGLDTAGGLGAGGGAGTSGSGGAGGTGGTGTDGSAGSANNGGLGGSSGAACAGGLGGIGGGAAAGGSAAGGNTGGGGGGGGRFGGGGGEAGISEGGGGGGGGSSLVTGSNTTETAGSGRNAGNNTDGDYANNAGRGGAADGDGNPGRIVIFAGSSATTTIPGRMGQALTLDGVDDYVRLPTINPSSSITLAAWVRGGTTAGTSHDIINNQQDSWSLRYHDTTRGGPQFTIKVGGTYHWAYSNTPLDAGQWYHLVGTYDGETISFYINGTAATTTNTAPSGSLDAVTGNVYIGVHADGVSNPLQGAVDDVRIYNRALSASEITRMYHLGATTKIAQTLTSNPNNQNGLVAHWTFDGDTTTSVVADSSGNGHDGASTHIIDLNSATFDGTTFSISAQENNAAGIAFKPDGTKMYVVGTAGDDINPYTLSTPWDLSTASFDGATFSVSAQDGTPQGLFFKPDGTKMFVIGATNDTVYAYTLSSAWNVTTATYDSVSKSIATEETGPQSVFFKSDGTKMYVVGTAGDDVNPYTLSTPWLISSAVFDGTSFVLGVNNPAGLSFDANGSSMYAVTSGLSADTDIITPYILSSAWDVTTAVQQDPAFSVGSQVTDPAGVFFRAAGDKMYVVAGGSDDSVVSYSLRSSLINVTPGRIGQGIAFSKAAGDAMIVPNDTALGGFDDFSVAFWMKIIAWPTTNTLPFAVSKYNVSGNQREWGVILRGPTASPADVMNISLSTDGTSVTAVAQTPRSTIDDGNWHHILYKRNGSTVESWIDGSLAASDTFSGTLFPGTANLTIARRDGTDLTLDAQFDDVRIYNRALSSSEISRIYHLGATTKVNTTVSSNSDFANGLVGHWTFDGAKMYQNIGDSSGKGNNGTTSGQTSGTTTVPGRIGQALFFDGSDDFVNVSAASGINTSSFSVAFWVKPEQLRIQGFVERGSFSNTWRIFMDNTNGRVEFDARSDAENLVGSTNLPVKTWSHVAVTYDSSATTAKIYINGVLDGTNSAFTNPANTVSPTMLKFAPAHAVPYNGALDDVRFYNRTLSATEVRGLYQLGN